MQKLLIALLMLCSSIFADEFVKDFGKYKCKFTTEVDTSINTDDIITMHLYSKCNSNKNIKPPIFYVYDKEDFILWTNAAEVAQGYALMQDLKNKEKIDLTESISSMLANTSYKLIFPKHALYWKINEDDIKRNIPLIPLKSKFYLEMSEQIGNPDKIIQISGEDGKLAKEQGFIVFDTYEDAVIVRDSIYKAYQDSLLNNTEEN